MSTPKIPAPAMVFLSVLSARFAEVWDGLERDLTDYFGETVYDSGFFPFTQTDYYDAELGAPIERRILAYKKLRPHDELAPIKIFTNGLERGGASPEGARAFNLDPGLLSLERLVLATGKNFTHRIYQSNGIWADLTLMYQDGDWKSFPWTFPDYAEEAMLERLRKLRMMYKSLRSEHAY